MTAPRRWIRLDIGWEKSDWLADLEVPSKYCWVLLLGHVKAFGVCGCVKAMTTRGAAREFGVSEEAFTAMFEAGVRDNAIYSDGETWVITGWDLYQNEGAAERQRRHRKDRSRLSPLRDVTDSHGVSRGVTDSSAQTVTLTLTETETSTDSSPSAPKRRVRKVTEPTPLFEEVRAEYPKRLGGQGWQDAWDAIERHLKAGVSPEAILSGAKRYAAFVRHEGSEGTKFVKQASTFFGPGMHFTEEWHFNGNGKHQEPRACLPGSAGSVLP